MMPAVQALGLVWVNKKKNHWPAVELLLPTKIFGPRLK
jgi:hypothetical protein